MRGSIDPNLMRGSFDPRALNGTQKIGGKNAKNGTREIGEKGVNWTPGSKINCAGVSASQNQRCVENWYLTRTYVLPLFHKKEPFGLQTRNLRPFDMHIAGKLSSRGF